jgi:hypothetical protein
MRWVTVFWKKGEDFRGYAVEKHIYYWGAVAFGQSTAPGRTFGEWLVPGIWC